MGSDLATNPGEILRAPEPLDEVSTDSATSLSVGMNEPLRAWRLKARVDDREGEPAAGPQNPVDRLNHGVEIRNVHQGQVAGDAVERFVAHRVESLRVPVEIADAKRLVALVAPGDLEHSAREVDPDYAGSAPRERPRQNSLAAGEVAEPLPGHVSDDHQKRRQRGIV